MSHERMSGRVFVRSDDSDLFNTRERRYSRERLVRHEYIQWVNFNNIRHKKIRIACIVELDSHYNSILERERVNPGDDTAGEVIGCMKGRHIGTKRKGETLYPRWTHKEGDDYVDNETATLSHYHPKLGDMLFEKSKRRRFVDNDSRIIFPIYKAGDAQEVVTGGTKKGERFEDAVKREMLEEMGLIVEDMNIHRLGFLKSRCEMNTEIKDGYFSCYYIKI